MPFKQTRNSINPETIASHFDAPGQVVTVLNIDTGNVNDTFRVIKRTTYSENQFVLQRISNAVFPRPDLVMSNVKAITEHAHDKLECQSEKSNRIWQLPRVIETRDGLDFYLDAEGNYWQLSMIASATSHPKRF